MRFWIGGYGADHGGAAGEGIGMLQAGEPDSPLAGGVLSFTGTAVAAPSPSWVAPHPTLDVVYAALEGEGTVRAYRGSGPDRLRAAGPAVEAGAAVCHVSVAPDGAFLLASCWGDGRVVRVPLDASGALGAPVLAPAARDPYADGADPFADVLEEAEAPAAGPARRAADTDDLAAAARALREAAGEEFAHLVPEYDEPAEAEVDEPAPAEASGDVRVSRAHESVFVSGDTVVTTDLGFDLVRVWRRSGSRLTSGPQVALPQGTGPRHMVWHPSGHLYVLTEYSREVYVLAPDAAGSWRVVGGAPAAPGSLDGDTGAELAASRDGRFLYAGIRGSDTIGVLEVIGDGSAVRPVALAEAGVRKPRHHVVVRDTLLVAGQDSDEVASLTLDLRTGVPGRVVHRTAVPAPTCILPRRR
ncbi:lactonase family protein [Microbacterium sp. NPDC091313]